MIDKEIQEKNIIERYILHQLEEDERDSFEEHLLYCDNCRRELEFNEQVIGAIQEISYEEDREKMIIQIILVSIFSWLKHLIQIPKILLRDYYQKHTKVLKINIAVVCFLVLFCISTFSYYNLFVVGVYNPETYKINPLPEKLMKPVRSSSLFKFEYPQQNENFKKQFNGKVKIKFKGIVYNFQISDINPVYIKIFSNNEEDYDNDSPLMDFIIPFKINTQKNVYSFDFFESLSLPRGLYYYTVEQEDNENLLYIGKFFVNQIKEKIENSD